MHEFERIAKYFAPLAAPEGLGLRDDAAVLSIPEGMELVITKDVIVSGVHVRGAEPPERLAQKALRVNLSDLAAKGAQPLHYMVGLMVPDVLPAWFEAFARGLAEDQRAFGLSLIGGDTTRSSTLAISITAFGVVPRGAMLTRAGAKVGHGVYVSGTIGKGVLGLKGDARFAEHYELPTPQLALGMRLRGVASACMDVSDGFLQDAGHIAQASNVGLVLHAPRIPLADGAQELLLQLTGGDDYELLFTSPHDVAGAVHIGDVVAGSGVKLLDESGQAIAYNHGGYQHF